MVLSINNSNTYIKVRPFYLKHGGQKIIHIYKIMFGLAGYRCLMEVIKMEL
jgi:hypothetical protein